MSTTLARRIRRIGLLPTTYKDVLYTVLTNENGTEAEAQRTKKVPVRHRETLTEQQIAEQTQQFQTAAREARRARKESERKKK